MKKFTEKQLETFVQSCKDGMIKRLCEDGYTTTLRSIARTLIEHDNGDIVNAEITINEIVSMFDEREENYHLAKALIDDLSTSMKRALLSEYKQYIPKPEVNRKELINLLGLRDFATKEDILKELNEIL